MKNEETKLVLRPEFRMSSADMAILNALPDNRPDTRLTAKQIVTVGDLYHKYLHSVTYGWGNQLFELEQKEKWPSAGKVKRHEAKRIVLCWLVGYSTYYAEMSGAKALDFLLRELTSREANTILINKAYTIQL